MWQKFCKFLLTKVLGWTVDNGPAPEKKCIILGVPHTCIGDFVISYLFYTSVGHSSRCMVKQEMFKIPLVGLFLRKIGAIPVDRTNASSLVRSIITEMESTDEDFHLCIAPEGTRKLVKHWKAGYHHIAKATGCTVYAGYFDWKRKRIGVGKPFPLTDDAKADTQRLQAYYHDLDLGAKHPEKYFTI